MSLIGNLEDLSLPDILQIISLSKKSGVLIIQRGSEEGRIYIRQGKVIQTASARHRRNIGDIVLEKGLLTRERLLEAVAAQKQSGGKDLLGTVFVRMKVLDQDTLEHIVQEQIQETIFFFLSWKEGTFKFDLRAVDERLEVEVDPQDLVSQQGIDTQWLVLEGTRLLDEGRRKAGIKAKDGPETAAGEEKVDTRQVILVDDDDYFSDLFTKAATKRGLALTRFSGVVEAREFLLSSLGGEGLFVVVDVVMPTSDGRGFLGGVELAKLIAAEYPEVTLRIITAYPDESVQDELRRIKVPPLILKPSLAGSAGTDQALASFLDEVFGAPAQMVPVDEKARKEAAAEGPSPVSAAAAVVAEGPVSSLDQAALGAVGPESPSKDEGAESQAQKALAELEGVLKNHPAHAQLVGDLVQEIGQAGSPSEIGLVVLRLSSELLERAILFKASRGEVVSLGGFGFEAGVMKNRDGLRNLILALDSSPLLMEAVLQGKARTSVSDTFDDEDVLAKMVGQPLPGSWLIIPAPGPGASVIVLYGDSGAAGRPIAEVEVLSRFFVLAGLRMRQLAALLTGQKVPASGTVPPPERGGLRAGGEP